MINYFVELIKGIIFLPKDLDAYFYMRNIKIKENEIGIPMYEHLGDTFITCSLIKQIKKQYKCKVAVIVPSKYAHIPKLFCDIDRIIVCDKLISQTNYINISRLIKASPKFIKNIIFKLFIKLEKGKIAYLSILNPNISFQKKLFFRYSDRFGIDFVPSKPSRPSRNVYERVKQKFRDMGLKERRTIIIYPKTYSAPLLDEKFWEKLTEKLKRKGYAVVTNVVGDDKLIKGTIPLFIPLEEQIATAEIAGTVIGVRSGIFDLLAYAKCKKIILYTGYMDKTKKYLESYSIRNLPYRGQIHEIKINTKDKLDYITEVVKSLKVKKSNFLK